MFVGLEDFTCGTGTGFAEVLTIKSAATSFLWGTLLASTLAVPVLWEWFSALPLDPGLTGLRADAQAVFLHDQDQWLTFAALFLNACAWIGLAGHLCFRDRNGKTSLETWCLSGFLVLVGLHYVIRYGCGSRSSESMVLLGGIAIGGVWRALWPSASGRRLALWIWIGMCGMALAGLHDWPWFQVFQYRGVRRDTGLWSNPNTFGLLAGCLAAASFAWLLKLAPWDREESPLTDRASAGMSLSSRRWAWLLLLPLATASIGLVRSFSRGAWLGMLFAMVWCAWCRWEPDIRRLHRQARSGDRTARGRLAISRLLVVILFCGGLSALWRFKDLENPLLRRMGTVANRTDRSWRNRVDAWIGAAKMTAERPLTGWGLGRVELVFHQKFRPPHLKETAAIQLNDYLTLAAGMGLPALGPFAALVMVRVRTAHRGRDPNIAPILVLLVGCWFDGVLFRLSLAVPFWTLLLASTPFPLGVFARKSTIKHSGQEAGQSIAENGVGRPSVLPEGNQAAPVPGVPIRWLGGLPARHGAGLIALMLLVAYIYWPDIHGGLRYRLDPWVREAADLVAGHVGTEAKADALHDWMHGRNNVDPWTHRWLGDIDWVSAGAQGGCRAFCEAYSRIGNAGIPATCRPLIAIGRANGCIACPRPSAWSPPTCAGAGRPTIAGDGNRWRTPSVPTIRAAGSRCPCWTMTGRCPGSGSRPKYGWATAWAGAPSMPILVSP